MPQNGKDVVLVKEHIPNSTIRSLFFVLSKELSDEQRQSQNRAGSPLARIILFSCILSCPMIFSMEGARSANIFPYMFKYLTFSIVISNFQKKSARNAKNVWIYAICSVFFRFFFSACSELPISYLLIIKLSLLSLLFSFCFCPARNCCSFRGTSRPSCS